jgi:hypothetical protein
MLLEIAIDLQIIQVVEGEGPPPSSVTGEHYCAHCNQRLHGHGWRRRYFLDKALDAVVLWIHRKLCPLCKTTYTLLPTWMHAFKIFSVETILATLAYKLKRGRFCSFNGISGYLQRQWFKHFDKRLRITEDFVDHHQVLNESPVVSSCMAAKSSLIVVKTVPVSRMAWYLNRPTHQRLYLYLPMALP